MDPIDAALPLYGVGNNPFLLEFLSHQAAPLPPAPTALAPSIAETQSVLLLDRPRLSMDPQYLADSLALILARAREYFLYGYYDAAIREYKEYLSLEHLYSKGYDGITGEYFQVLFEYSWLSDIHHREKETERILNESLLWMLEPILKEKPGTPPSQQVARQFLLTMQELGQLPSAQTFRSPVTDDSLMKVVKKLMSQGELPVAQLILGQVEVRNLLMVFRADLMARQLAAQDMRVGGPSVMLPIIYARIGLPYAPVNPMAHEADRDVFDHEIPEQSIFAPHIHWVEALDKDPNEENERQRRQQRQKMAFRRRGFSSRGPVAPV